MVVSAIYKLCFENPLLYRLENHHKKYTAFNQLLSHASFDLLMSFWGSFSRDPPVLNYTLKSRHLSERSKDTSDKGSITWWWQVVKQIWQEPELCIHWNINNFLCS